MKRAQSTLKEFLTAMGYDATISPSEIAGQTIFSIEGVANQRDLIGMHGDTIHAIDYLVKKIVEKKSMTSEGADAKESTLFLVDVGDYRSRKIKDLLQKAKMMADRARSFQYDVELSPMSSYERLIIHTALQNEPQIKTESQGEGRNRRVVIKYSA